MTEGIVVAAMVASVPVGLLLGDSVANAVLSVRRRRARREDARFDAEMAEVLGRWSGVYQMYLDGVDREVLEREVAA